MNLNPYNPGVSELERVAESDVKNDDQHRGVRAIYSLPRTGAAIALLAYTMAILSEAAYYAGGIGFNEILTVERMLDAISCVGPADVTSREYGPADWTALFGMLIALSLWGEIWRKLPIGFLAAYFIVFLAVGGWPGLIVVPFTPFLFWEPMDGEFIADGVARFFALGVWAFAVLSILGWKFLELRRSSR